jgi:peptidyl-prolyl cis-trans isomerase D
MLQKIRDNAHGWWAYVAVPILILIFALFGINNYLTGSLSQTDIAKVNGDSISYTDFAMLYQQMSRQQNPNQDKNITLQLKVQVLQNLINQQLFYQALQDLGFGVTASVIDNLIYQTPAFQVQGKFSMNQYQLILQNLGITTEALRNSLTKSYLIQQFQGGVISSEFALATEAQHETQLANLVRDVNYVMIDPAMFANTARIADTDVATYYQSHQSQFMTPYQVKLQYLTLSLSQFTKQIKDTAQAQAAYQNAVNSLANTVFQNSDSLTPAANMLKAPVQTTGWLSANTNTGLFANPQVLAAAMSDNVLNGGNNSSVISLSDNQVLVLRVLDKKAPTPLALQQVAPQIKNMLVMQQEINAAGNVAKQLQSALNNGANLTELAAEQHLNLQTAKSLNLASKNLDSNLLASFMQAPVRKGVLASSKGKLVVFQVTDVYMPQKLTVQIPPQVINGLWTQIEIGSFLANLQAAAKIKTNDALLKAQ